MTLYKNHKGPVGFLDDIMEELITILSKWRVCGMPVTHFAVVRKVGQFKPDFLTICLLRIYRCASCTSLPQTTLFIVLLHTLPSTLQRM
jgi:hypothetical protein